MPVRSFGHLVQKVGKARTGRPRGLWSRLNRSLEAHRVLRLGNPEIRVAEVPGSDGIEVFFEHEHESGVVTNLLTLSEHRRADQHSSARAAKPAVHQTGARSPTQ